MMAQRMGITILKSRKVMANKKLIYTVNLNGYDSLKPVRIKCQGYDYKCFTDDKTLKVAGWEMVLVEPKENILLQSREIKLLIHKYVKGYDLYVYIDANIEIRIALSQYVNRYFKKGILLHTHPIRECTYAEARKVIDARIDNPETINIQMQKYVKAGLRKRYGLFANGFFMRDNSVNGFMELWYRELTEHSYRDQLSLPYCIFKHKPQMSVMQHFQMRRYVSFQKHAKDRVLSDVEVQAPAPKVWYFTPGRGDKNLGRAYNEHCALASKGDWICIRDGDTMFLNPYWSKQIEDIIVKHGRKYPLISCVTNRLGLDWQLPYGFDEGTDIMPHLERANNLFQDKYDIVTTSPRQTAGLFMLFPRETWMKVKFAEGLTNGGQFVDFTFADAVMKKLGKIGIAQGIYLLHLYRMGKKKTNIDHLL